MGFPDLVLVHPEHGLLFRELKGDNGRIRPEQEAWLEALLAARADARLWTAADWRSGAIELELRGQSTLEGQLSSRYEIPY